MKLIVNGKEYECNFNIRGYINIFIDKNFTIDEVIFYMEWERNFNITPTSENCSNLQLISEMNTYTVHNVHPEVDDEFGRITFIFERLIETKLPNF